MKKKLRRFKIWYLAHFKNYPFWRVVYAEEGERTRPLTYREAKPLYDIWGKKLFIDYNYAEKFLK